MAKKLVPTVSGLCLIAVLLSCSRDATKKTSDAPPDGKVRLVVLDPGHYHAALVQKTMYDRVDPAVRVYAPDGPEVREYLERIRGFNSRPEDPTSWREHVYTGPDYLEAMQGDKAGNVVVISGNNQKKTEYIMAAIDAGLNVFSDKPMCIDAAGFAVLERAFAAAEARGLLLYDIMTERFNRLCMLQKRLVLDRDVFGELQKGSAANPAVVKESVHHFFKYISGKPVRRPTWYFDTSQQGEGLVDVTTHLIDLVTWTCFPEQVIDYRNDVTVISGRHWPTMIAKSQYAKVTGAADFPDFLQDKLNDDGVLPYLSNGEIVYVMRGVHVKLAVTWDFEAPPGAGDTHHSLFRGSRSHVIIRQGAEQNYRPQLYVEPAPGVQAAPLGRALEKTVARLQGEYPGLALEPHGPGWHLVVPQELLVGHEAHFRTVMETYLHYLSEGKLPDWEIAYMTSKYYITTTALEMARQDPTR